MRNYDKHILYCKDKWLKSVGRAIFHKRINKWWGEARAITTPHQWHWGARKLPYYTIVDDWREWMKDNNVKLSYQTYRTHDIANTLDQKLKDILNGKRVRKWKPDLMNQ
jgi:hypothetical protein